MVEELLGPAPKGWSYTTLGEACREGGGDIQTGPFGSQLHAADYVPAGIPSIMPANIGDNRILEDEIARIAAKDAERLSRYRVRAGDIVYSRRGDVERRALVRSRENGWLCGTGCLRVRLGEHGPNPSFTAYYLGHPSVREWIVRHAHGATMPNLNTAILGACPFLVPPPEEQRAIAYFLGTLDDKIDLNRRMSETLEAMARALFKSWFVDFEPVRAKAERRVVDKPNPLAALFPDSLEESPLGEVPAGWRYKSLGELVSLTRGKTYKSSLKNHAGPVLLGLATIERNGGFRDDKLATYGGDSPKNLLLTPGDLFVSLKDVTQAGDLLGAVAQLPRHIPSGRLTQDTVRLDFRSSDLSRGIVYRTLLSGEYRAYCRAHATGTTNLGLSREDFLAYPILVPPRRVALAFERMVGSLQSRMESAIENDRTLSALRDLILPKLISGELRVEGGMKRFEGIA